MKKLIAFFLILSSPLTSHAADLSLSVDFLDGYVEASGQRSFEGSAQIISFDAGFENGMYINVMSVVDGYERIEELDYTFGYAWELSDRVSIDLSLGLWDISDLGISEYDAFAQTVRVDYFISEGFSTYISAESVITKNSEYSGFETYIGLSKKFQIVGDVLSVTGSVMFGYDSTYGVSQQYSKFTIAPVFLLNEKVAVRFLNVSAWFPKETQKEFEVTFIGIDYLF